MLGFAFNRSLLLLLMQGGRAHYWVQRVGYVWVVSLAVAVPAFGSKTLSLTRTINAVGLLVGIPKRYRKCPGGLKKRLKAVLAAAAAAFEDLREAFWRCSMTGTTQFSEQLSAAVRPVRACQGLSGPVRACQGTLVIPPRRC